MKRRYLLLLLIPVWIGSISINAKLNRLPLNREERMSMVISSPEVRPFLLGYETVIADYIWIRTMLYFGGNYGSGDLQWLKEMIRSVIMLNPRFFPPYEFAGVLGPDVVQDYDFSREILYKGIGRVSEGEERLMFYLAFLYYTHYKDYGAAADLLSYAATADYAPTFWKKFAASLYNDSGQKDYGLQFLLAMYESTESPQIREQLEEKIEEVAKEQGLLLDD